MDSLLSCDSLMLSLSHLSENWWWISFSSLVVSKQHSMFGVFKAHVNYNGHIALFNSVNTSQPHLRLFAETSSDHLKRITCHSHTLILYLWLVLCNQGNVASRWRGHPAVLHEMQWLLAFKFQFISSGLHFRHIIAQLSRTKCNLIYKMHITGQKCHLQSKHWRFSSFREAANLHIWKL